MGPSTHRSDFTASSSEHPQMPKPAATKVNRRALAAVVLVVMAATALAMLPALGNEFVDLDDGDNFVKNVHYRGLGLAQLRWMWTTFHMGPYQPLSWMSLGLDYVVWGMDPFGYHLTSLVLHVLNAGLFCLVAARLLSADGSAAGTRANAGIWLGAGAAALAFGVHPLRAESVAWVTERRDVLSGCFYLLMLLAYLRAADASLDGRRRLIWLAASLVACALSLLSKAMGMTVAAVLLILDVYPLRRMSDGRRRVLLEKLPYLALGLVIAVVAVVGQSSAEAIGGPDQPTLAGRGARIAYAVVFYLHKTLLPFGLGPRYEVPADLDPLAARFVLCGVAALSVTVLLLWFRKRYPWALAAWLCYGVLLAPVSGVVPVGWTLVADRYSYLVCLPWAVLAGAGVHRLWLTGKQRGIGAGPARAAGVAAAAMVVGYGALGWRQTRFWRDSFTLWKRAAAVYPEGDMVQLQLGQMLQDQERYEEAIAHYRAALARRPNAFVMRNQLGNALLRVGRVDEAIAEYERALDIKPDLHEARFNLGNALRRQGRLEEAVQHLEVAVAANPGFTQAQLILADLHADRGDQDQAVACWRQALHSDPSLSEARRRLHDALQSLARFGEAAETLRAGLRVDPGNPELINNLAWLLATCPDASVRNGAEAVALARTALESSSPAPRAPLLDTLAAALAEAGRFEDAIAQARSAIDAADTAGDRELAAEIAARLALYEDGKPFRTPAG